MSRSALTFLCGGALVSAIVASPAIEPRESPSPPSPLSPAAFERLDPAPVPAPDGFVRAPHDPPGAPRRFQASQTMGSGELNVALDAGENALVGAGPADDGEGDDPRDEGD